MTHGQDCSPGCDQLGEELEHEVGGRLVEAAGRLVRQKEIRGSFARARATATRCRSPPDIVAGRSSARSQQVEQLEQHGRALDSLAARARWVPNMAASTFSRAVRRGIRL